MSIHPRNAYDMLSFQNERYPCQRQHYTKLRLTALSLIPNNKISSIIVNRGILVDSPLSWKSLGSYAIFPLPSTPELGAVGERAAGVGALFDSKPPVEEEPIAGEAPPARRLVSPSPDMLC